MIGSMFSAISGLKNHSTWMNVVGNNISNVNTVAYKMQRITFKEQITQSLGAASGANTSANLGGINPQQMGLGSALGSIDTIMTQGAIQTTGNPLDVAITGEGFFMAKSGSKTTYTRAGNFLQDNAGNLVASNGGIVQGWSGGIERTFATTAGYNPAFQIDAANYVLNTDDVSQVGNLTIPKDLTMSAQATRFVKIGGNLDSNTTKNNYASVAAAAGTGTPLPANYSPDAYTAGAQVPLAGGAGSIQQRTTYVAAPVPPATNWPAATIAFFHTNPADVNSAKITPDATSTFTVYDSLGNPRSLTIWFFQHGVAAAGTARPVWDWYAFDTTNSGGVDPFLTGEPDFYNCVGGTNITTAATAAAGTAMDTNSAIWFNDDGSLASNGGSWAAPGAAASLGGRQNLATTINGETIYGPMITFTQASSAQGIMPDGALDLAFQLDFGTPNSWNTSAQADGTVRVNNATNTPIDQAQPGLRDGLTGDVTGSYQIVGGVSTYIPNNTPYTKEVDGWRAGDLLSLSVDNSGGIVGQFSNERSITIAKLAIATFMNAQGLSKSGGNMYSTTSNSGIARVVASGEAGSGSTIGGALEASNVDLSVELTNMIIAQRGFESNARVITTSSNMLDTLVNLGR